MPRAAHFLQADVERVIRAAKKCGAGYIRVIIDRQGKIEAIIGKPANDEQSPVELD